MLYTVITFVALFIIAAVCAVIFYIKAEDFKTRLNNQTNDMVNIALEKEQRNLTKVIGKKLKGKSYLGTLGSYLDDMLSATTGKLPEDELTFEEKVNSAKMKINETISTLGQSASGTYGPEGIDLIQTIITLKSDLDTANHNLNQTRKMLNDLQDEFDIAVENFRIEERRLSTKRITTRPKPTIYSKTMTSLTGKVNSPLTSRLTHTWTNSKKLRQNSNRKIWISYNSRQSSIIPNRLCRPL